MTEFLSTLEEFDLAQKLQFPQFLFIQKDTVSQKRLAFEILSRKENEIILVTSDGFEYGGVLAGLSEKHIEHIAKSGPRDYKENILKSIRDQKILAEIGAIAKAMDEDLGGGSTRHQTRVKNVIQYIKDNQVVFEF